MERGLERLIDSGARGALLVVHKGVIRTIAEKLLGGALEDADLRLGGVVTLSRGPDDTWHRGRRSSDPEPLRESAA